MVRILISTTYSDKNSIVLCATKLSVDRIYLLIDKTADKTQLNTVKDLKKSFGSVIEIIEKKVDVYDIVSVAKSTADLIDSFSIKDEIYANITPSRKTQALGLLFGCYSKNPRIKGIYYVAEETKELINLPVLSFDVSSNQQKILENIEQANQLTKLAEKLEISRAMLYRNIKELKHKGLIEENNGFTLTEAGKIAML